ncbi:membrane protein [Labrys miyagiensis]|uniref:Membrane protein n=1 Tax=Labrys miyagiensis TaxID=346912 RepID=A0ABQ6CEN8_9HYPH|nr:outer membrane protein [Labrys miyagiensis]GLS18736.1 membrane protein [Labrys miyagiensis]
MRLGALALLGSLVGAMSASAADLAPVAPEPVAPVVAPVTWTGFYIGAGIGGRTNNTDWTTTTAFFPAFLGTRIPMPFRSAPNASVDSTDFRGSIYGGYNWQFAPTWVAGLEGDIGYAKNSGRISRIPGLTAIGASFAESELTTDGSVRARVGYLVTPSILLYATGGVAFQQIKNSTTCPADTFVCNPAVGTQSFHSSDTLVGYTIGAGAEAMIYDHWLVRAEYRFSDFGSNSFTAIPPTISTFGADAKTKVQTHNFGVGIAYKF